MAREVVEMYGDEIMAHPVGTGSVRLADWRRFRASSSSESELTAKSTTTSAPAGEPVAQAVAQLKGSRLPLVDRVEVSIIDETQPRWLAFLNREHDILERVPAEFVNIADPQRRLAPNLAKRGVTMRGYLRADVRTPYFSMKDPVVGGYTPEKVALRRAISLAINVDEEIRSPRGPGDPGAGRSAAHLGLRPAFKSEMSEYDLRARQGAARHVRLCRPRRRRLARAARRLAAGAR